jgi:hypothetical protein
MTVNPESLGDASVGDFVSRMSRDLSTLIRDEVRLAQAEITAKAKRVGLGLGLFGGGWGDRAFRDGRIGRCAILGLATASTFGSRPSSCSSSQRALRPRPPRCTG